MPERRGMLRSCHSMRIVTHTTAGPTTTPDRKSIGHSRSFDNRTMMQRSRSARCVVEASPFEIEEDNLEVNADDMIYPDEFQDSQLMRMRRQSLQKDSSRRALLLNTGSSSVKKEKELLSKEDTKNLSPDNSLSSRSSGKSSNGSNSKHNKSKHSAGSSTSTSRRSKQGRSGMKDASRRSVSTASTCPMEESQSSLISRKSLLSTTGSKRRSSSRRDLTAGVNAAAMDASELVDESINQSRNSLSNRREAMKQRSSSRKSIGKIGRSSSRREVKEEVTVEESKTSRRSQSSRREGMRRSSSKREVNSSSLIPTSSMDLSEENSDNNLNSDMSMSMGMNQSSNHTRSSLSRRREGLGRTRSASRRSIMSSASEQVTPSMRKSTMSSQSEQITPTMRRALDESSRRSLSKRREALTRSASKRSMSSRKLLMEQQEEDVEQQDTDLSPKRRESAGSTASRRGSSSKQRKDGLVRGSSRRSMSTSTKSSRKLLMEKDEKEDQETITSKQMENSSRRSLSKRREGLTRAPSSRRSMSAGRSSRNLLLEQETEDLTINAEEDMATTSDDFAFEANFDDITPAAIAMGTGSSSKMSRSKSEKLLTSSKIRRSLSEKYDKDQKELQQRCGELKVKPSTITAKDFANWEDLQQNGGMNKISPAGAKISPKTPPNRRDGLAKSMSKRSMRGGLTGLGLMRQQSYRGLGE